MRKDLRKHVFVERASDVLKKICKFMPKFFLTVMLFTLYEIKCMSVDLSAYLLLIIYDVHTFRAFLN